MTTHEHRCSLCFDCKWITYGIRIVDHHVLIRHELVQRLLPTFPAKSALFGTTERGLTRHCTIGVHPYSAGFDRSRHPYSAGNILRPNSRGQPVPGRVADFNGFLLSV